MDRDKYYILSLNPQAQAEWERLVLRNPITGSRPDLSAEIARAVGDRAGSYLVKVSLQVEVLEHMPAAASNKTIKLAS